MRLSYCLMLITLACLFTLSGFVADKSKKYQAKVITAVGSFEGELKLDIYGSNEGEISIKTADGKDSKSGIKLNAKLIEQVIIDSVTYYMEDLNDKGYDNKNRYLVTKIYGNDTLGLFSHNTGNSIEYYAGQANTEYLQNINHEKLNGKTSYFYIAKYFSACKVVAERIKSKQEGYYTTETMSVQERLSFWKKVIDEYSACR